MSIFEIRDIKHLKQFIVILFFLSYLASVAEVSFHSHFCGKKFQYTTLYKAKEKNSCCGEHGKESGCCHDEVVKADIDDHKQATKLLYTHKEQLPDGYVSHVPYLISLHDFYTLIEKHVYALPPPPLISTKAYINNCVFLI